MDVDRHHEEEHDRVEEALVSVLLTYNVSKQNNNNNTFASPEKAESEVEAPPHLLVKPNTERRVHALRKGYLIVGMIFFSSLLFSLNGLLLCVDHACLPFPFAC